jgi:ketosteroid isomerase-like protein
MSEENVEAFKRGNEALNRQDVEAMLKDVDPEVQWQDVFGVMLVGEAKVYRGHQEVRELFRDLFAAFAEIRSEYPEIRDLGDRLVAIGHLWARGKESGAEIESPVASVCEMKNGKVAVIRTYLDPKEALVAAGLGE